MFSINSLNGNSFFDIGLQYQQLQRKELGDESYNAPSELRDTEKASLSSSGDSSFSNFLKSFHKFHSLITAYVFKSDANTSNTGSRVSDLKKRIDDINIKLAKDKVKDTYSSNEELFEELRGDIDEQIKFFFDDFEHLKIYYLQSSIIGLVDSKKLDKKN